MYPLHFSRVLDYNASSLVSILDQLTHFELAPEGECTTFFLQPSKLSWEVAFFVEGGLDQKASSCRSLFIFPGQLLSIVFCIVIDLLWKFCDQFRGLCPW